MRVKPEYRDRDETEVAVLDALADRAEEGMTIFELRTHVDEDIDTLEDALAALKSDDLIEAAEDGERTVIRPDEGVVGPETRDESGGYLAALRRRLPF
ncbi:MAG: DUF6432 family protein [Salinirussus sp.]